MKEFKFEAVNAAPPHHYTGKTGVHCGDSMHPTQIITVNPDGHISGRHTLCKVCWEHDVKPLEDRIKKALLIIRISISKHDLLRDILIEILEGK